MNVKVRRTCSTSARNLQRSSQKALPDLVHHRSTSSLAGECAAIVVRQISFRCASRRHPMVFYLTCVLCSLDRLSAVDSPQIMMTAHKQGQNVQLVWTPPVSLLRPGYFLPRVALMKPANTLKLIINRHCDAHYNPLERTRTFSVAFIEGLAWWVPEFSVGVPRAV